MSLFRCEECGCVENTACSGYWDLDKQRDLCSECDPAIGKWHDEFDKESASGMHIGEDGFLYEQERVDAGEVRHTKIVGKVK